ncbi:DNA polymerase beta thumb [uncultured archaeon]|nr:DNA polymerase beta thumb [uncultured archaeon]
MYQGVHVDLFLTDTSSLPFALLHHTGDKNYNIIVRNKAKHLGYKLNQYGLFKGDEKIKKKFKSERQVIEFIGLTYKSPKDRT